MSEPNPFPNANETGSNVNPYAAPSLDATNVSVPLDGAEAVRREHLNHEASVKSIGFLYLLGCVFTCLGGIMAIVAAISATPGSSGAYRSGYAAGIGTFYIVVGSLQGFVGAGLRKLKPWSRRAGIAFSVLGLLAIPIGTLISAYFLYLLASSKGKMVFSEEYKAVIAQTPHVKYKTSKVVWILLGVFVLLLTLGIVSALFSA